MTFQAQKDPWKRGDGRSIFGLDLQSVILLPIVEHILQPFPFYFPCFGTCNCFLIMKEHTKMH
jgi:hypothetical protein